MALDPEFSASSEAIRTSDHAREQRMSRARRVALVLIGELQRRETYITGLDDVVGLVSGAREKEVWETFHRLNNETREVTWNGCYQLDPDSITAREAAESETVPVGPVEVPRSVFIAAIDDRLALGDYAGEGDTSYLDPLFAAADAISRGVDGVIRLQ